ncbi:ABC transporter ATP-binding protein [Vibrio nitrifigilis]|uniref:ABC transporter ATP-binding protein n=1 Tax=Vibrio nitrifigilis TaxID=2789781 RepID=A0ABS0GFK6_9VIBR|nr:ABC transporter ATP-binding protein [Vibrio nitrifigilis]MBF9001211.1 ABC transporter ATP-binding protein [Vibrio nitrifigilis]
MIQIKKLSKYYTSAHGKQHVFQNLNFSFPSQGNIALLGRNGSGKSTLFRIIGGSEYPNSGHVYTDKAISWPVALATGIHPQMTGRENTRFIGRVNGVDNLELYEAKVKKFAELGDKYDLPVKNYSSGMRSRLAFGCCIAIDFDIYLIDEVTSVGDQKFRKKAKQALLDKKETSSMIMVSHDIEEIKQFCDSAVILHQGALTYFADLNEGLSVYKQL